MKRKQIIALMMVIVMAAGLVTGCGKKESEDTIQGATVEGESSSASGNSGDTEDEEALLKAMESVAGTSSVAKKQETVYVKTSATGKVDSVTVSNWLQNTEGSAELKDSSNLNNITNIKGKQNYTVNGIEVVWDAAGDDIYYQGTTEKELPVDVTITYELDGREVTPEELAGASGHVVMKMNYINKSVNTFEIGGKQETIYTPFAVLSGMMLDTEKFRNVSVSNGTVVSDGNRNIVVGMAFPGFVDSLNGGRVDDDDILSKIEDKISIPSDVVVEADVKNFELGMTITMINSDVMSALGLEDVDTDLDLGDLTDDLDEFSDAGEELVDGTGKLRDGAQELSDGVVDLVPGTQDLYDGIVEYTDGVVKVDDGVVKLRDGAVELDNGMTTLKDGIGKLDEGAGSLADGAKQVSQGVNQVVESMGSLATAQAGAGQISAGINALAEKTGSLSQSDAMVQAAIIGKALSGSEELQTAFVSAGLDPTDAQVLAGSSAKTLFTKSVAAGKYGLSSTDETAVQAEKMARATAYVDGLIEGGKGIAGSVYSSVTTPQAEGSQSLKDGASALATGLGASTSPEAASSLQKLKEGAAKVATGASELKSGTNQLVEGADKLKSGTCSLKNGTVELYDGTQELKGHNQELIDGAAELKDGSVDLVDGIDKLRDGTIELNDGMIKFDEEGIQKLTDIFDTDYDSMEQRIHAITDAGKAYKSFTGTSEDEESSVRFVVESAAIKK